MTLNEYLNQITPNYSGYQELHVHTQGSYRDAVNSVEDVFDAAELLGRQAVAITDHGNFTRLFTALKERTKREKNSLQQFLKNGGVPEDKMIEILSSIGDLDSIRNPTDKMIPYLDDYGNYFVEAVHSTVQFVAGIEMYATDGPEDNKARHHLVLYAVDWIGMKQLNKLCNLAQLNKYKDAPQVTFDTLTKFVGPGTEGHGKVIATSACMSGHLSRILLRPQMIQNKIDAIQKKLSGLDLVHLSDITYLEGVLEERQKDSKVIRQDRNNAKKAVDKSFDVRITKAKNKVINICGTIEETKTKAFKTEEKRKEKLDKLEADLLQMQETVIALEQQKADNETLARSLPEKEKQLSEFSDAIKAIKAEINNLKKKAEPQIKLQNTITELENQLDNLNDVYSLAKETAIKYNSIFGMGNYFIELQNHGIEEELYCLPLLKQISADTKIPMTVANDVHYATPKEKRKRDLVAAMRFNTPIAEVEQRVGNDQLYFKTNEQMEILFSDMPEAIENTTRIAERCNLFYKKEMHLPEFDTGSEISPKEYLEHCAKENISIKYPDYQEKDDDWKQTMQERLDYELKIIDQMGYNSYIAIVQDFIFYARKIGGDEAVGPGRGSGAGSIVCYLLGITDVDPLRYGLLFERFLNPDRVSMPDIDTDFAPSIRDDVVSYVAEKYAYHEDYAADELKGTVCNINTEGVLAGRSAIRNTGRVTGIPLDVCDRVAKMIPSKPGMTIFKAFDANPDFKNSYDTDNEVKTLINDALLVEGMPDHTGVHAAGVIIADKPISEYAPMFFNEKKQVWVIQYDMVSCETDLGLLKMDFLGLKTLDIIRTAKRFVKDSRHTDIDFKKVNKADNTAVFENVYAKGRTNGVFQFESSGMKQTLVNFAPKSIDDVALLNAAYRPGPLQYIPAVTEVKFNRAKADYIIPEMAEILDETYGKPIYQEQIQKIFNQIAGFSLGQADIIRRAMSKKKLKELVKYKDGFKNGLLKKGASEAQIEKFWAELLEFANYAFNKSHAVAYSIVSYYTAFEKYYYPAEYMAALLSYTPNDKVPLYIREAKNMGITVYSPDINKSYMSFVPTKDGNISFGLSNIKSVSKSAEAFIKEREENGPFTGFKDLICRMCIVGAKKTSIKNLILSGALDCIIKNRKSHVDILEEYMESCRNTLKKIKARTDAPKENNEICQLLKEEWIAPPIPNTLNFTKNVALEYEKDLIGFYTSGHPLDEYEEVLNNNATNFIAALEKDDEAVLAGQIKNLIMLNRKSDGKAMCKFMFEDLTGEIDAICFTKTYDEYKGIIADNAIVSIKGYADYEVEERDDEIIILNKQFVVKEVSPLTQAKRMVISAPLTVYQDVLQARLASLPRGNVEVTLNDTLCGELRKTNYKISLTKEFEEFLSKNNIEYV